MATRVVIGERKAIVKFDKYLVRGRVWRDRCKYVVGA